MVALLAHRARVAGLADPTAGAEKLHAGLIEAVPAHLRQDVEAALFVLRHAHLSLAARDELETAWQHYGQLSPQARRETVMCDFLMRLLNGAVRNRSHGLAFRALAEAMRRHPRATCGLLWRKVKARVRV